MFGIASTFPYVLGRDTNDGVALALRDHYVGKLTLSVSRHNH